MISDAEPKQYSIDNCKEQKRKKLEIIKTEHQPSNLKEKNTAITFFLFPQNLPSYLWSSNIGAQNHYGFYSQTIYRKTLFKGCM